MAGPPRVRGVVRDAARGHGATRATGLRAPAAHVRRPRPHRPRVSQLRRPDPRGAPDGPAALQVEERLRRAGTLEDVLSHASQEISRASHQVAFAISRATDASFEHLDFVPLDAGKSWSCSSRPAGASRTKSSSRRERYRADELQQAANFLNTEFKGVRSATCGSGCSSGSTRSARCTISSWPGRCGWPARRSTTSTRNRRSSSRARRSFSTTATADDPETTLATMRTLVRMMEEKRRLVQLIDACMDGKGLTVVIGSEHHRPRRPAAERRDLDLRRRPPDQCRRRDRSDAHALLARDQRRREPLARHQQSTRTFLMPARRQAGLASSSAGRPQADQPSCKTNVKNHRTPWIRPKAQSRTVVRGERAAASA